MASSGAAIAAAAAASAAAAKAADAAAKAGIPMEFQTPVIQEASAWAASVKSVKKQGLSKSETRRQINELWIKHTVPFIEEISDPTRLRIIHMLREHNSLMVGAIAKALKLKHSSTSQQLGRLRRANIVVAVQKGREVNYSLNAYYVAWKSRQVMEGLEG